jgi:hypothetical protein
MAEDYKINAVRGGFGLNAVKVFEYTPGIAINKAINEQPRLQEGFNVSEVTSKDIPVSGRTSLFGTPVFSELNLLPLKYTKFVNGVEQQVELAAALVVDTALFNIRQSKNIIKTDIQGSNFGGSVKEYINTSDFEISIKGGIFGTNGNYPKDEVRVLREYLNAPVSIGIDSEFLALFGIFEIVIEDYFLPQNKGRRSEQLFELQCSSNLNPNILL